MPLENQIRREDIGYRLAKALEIKGQGSPTLALDNIVVPVVVCEDLSHGDDLDYATNRWCRGRGSTPAGAQFGKLSFNNHVDSGILVRVYRVHLFADPASAGANVGIMIETSSTGGTQINFTKGFTDARLSFGNTGLFTPARLPSVDIRFDNSGGIGAHFWRGHITASTEPTLIEFGGLVLRPGTRLHFEAVDVNVEYNASVEWTETNL